MPRKKKAPTPPPGPPYHGRTPRTVLEAPVSVPETVTEQLGFSRVERRHGAVLSPAVRMKAAIAGRNIPFRSSKIRKIRRGRMARFNR